MVQHDRSGLQAAAPHAGPIRTCIGCRSRDSRSDLLRIVAVTDDGGATTAVPDPGARLPGRGAWLHPDIGCFELAVRRRAFPRALRRELRSLEAVREWLETLRSTHD
nr:YlxR family protein [Janibacter alkaliphilus]